MLKHCASEIYGNQYSTNASFKINIPILKCTCDETSNDINDTFTYDLRVSTTIVYFDEVKKKPEMNRGNRGQSGRQIIGQIDSYLKTFDQGKS